MREENIKNRNNSFEDKAWEDMRGRLDASMPMSSKNKSKEKWLLLLLLLVLVLSGSYIAYLKYSAIESEEEKIDKTEYIAAQDEQLHGYADELVANRGNADVPGETLVKKSDFPAKAELKDENSYGSSQDEKVQHVLYTATNVEDKPEEMVKNTPRGLLQITTLHNKNYLLSYLPASTISSEKMFTWKAAKKHGRKHSFAMSGGLISENFISYGGYELGVNYSLDLKKGFGFESGLLFTGFYKNGFSNSLALSSLQIPGVPPDATHKREDWVEKRYVYDVKNSEIINNEVGVEYITGIVDNLYYLNIPLNLSYSWKKNKVYAGANFSFLVKGTNKVRDYNDRYFNTVVLSSSVLENRHYFNRIDLGANLGFETNIVWNVQLYTRYSYGFTHVVAGKSGEETNPGFRDTYVTNYERSFPKRIDYNRYFSIGLRYNLASIMK